MGKPKLLLPWGRLTLIEHTLSAWQASAVTAVVVVVCPGDNQLAECVQATGARVVIPPTDPPEMKTSVQIGLEFVSRTFHPRALDAWLLAPADAPLISARVIDMLLEDFQRAPTSIIVPRCCGRRGHPVLFPWPMAGQVATLAADQGVNVLVDRGPTRYLECDDPGILSDVDTPADYERERNEEDH
jgi:molybdenum cofactor cytidylyltransferase